MSFRARLALVAASAVALAILTASFVIYFVVRDQLRATVDDSLADDRRTDADLASHTTSSISAHRPASSVGRRSIRKVVDASGKVYPTSDSRPKSGCP